MTEGKVLQVDAIFSFDSEVIGDLKELVTQRFYGNPANIYLFKVSIERQEKGVKYVQN